MARERVGKGIARESREGHGKRERAGRGMARESREGHGKRESRKGRDKRE